MSIFRFFSGAIFLSSILMSTSCTREDIYGIAQVQQTVIPISSLLGLGAPKIDIIVLVDSSGSMSEPQDLLAGLAGNITQAYFSGDDDNCIFAYTYNDYRKFQTGAPATPRVSGCSKDLGDDQMANVIQQAFQPGTGGPNTGIERPIGSLLAMLFLNELDPGTRVLRSDSFKLIWTVGDEKGQDTDFNEITGIPTDIANGDMNVHMVNPCGQGTFTYNLLDGGVVQSNLTNSGCATYDDPSEGNIPEVSPRKTREAIESVFREIEGDNYNGFGMITISNQTEDTLRGLLGCNPGQTCSGEYAPNTQIEALTREVRDNVANSRVAFRDIGNNNIENVVGDLEDIVTSINQTTSLQFQVDTDEVVSVEWRVPDGSEDGWTAWQVWSAEFYQFSGDQFLITTAGVDDATGRDPEMELRLNFYPESLSNQ